MTPTNAEIQARIEQHLAALLRLYGLINVSRPTGWRLTPRELQVLTLRAATPLTMREIGERLSVTEDAAKAAAKVGRRKLGVSRPDQLQAALAHAVGVAA